MRLLLRTFSHYFYVSATLLRRVSISANKITIKAKHSSNLFSRAIWSMSLKRVSDSSCLSCLTSSLSLSTSALSTLFWVIWQLHFKGDYLIRTIVFVIVHFPASRSVWVAPDCWTINRISWSYVGTQVLVFVIEYVELDFIWVTHVLLVHLHVFLLPHFGLLAPDVVFIAQSRQFASELIHELELPLPMLDDRRQPAHLIQSLI